MISKTNILSEAGCKNCILLLKFYCLEGSKSNLYLQSPDKEIELKDKVMISDFLNEKQKNKYQIHAYPNMTLLINVHIQEGNVLVTLTDSFGMREVRNSTDQHRIVQFHIKA